MYTQAMDTMRDEGGEKPALRSAEEAQLQQRFDNRIDAGDFIEAKDWMPENYRKTLLRQISQHAHSEIVGLLHGGVDELLPQGVVADTLDAPAHALRRVGALVVGRAEHHQAGPPPAIHRFLHHGPLCVAAVLHHHQQAVEALALVEAFLAADAHQGRTRPQALR
jgi:hypothetical protein